MKKAVGYVRVSTEEQSREGISLEMQAAKIRQYAELNDLDLAEIIQDAGISGKSVKARPGIQSILGMVQAHKIDAVVVYKLDRLARNTVECLEMAKLMDKAGVSLHSISEKLDTQSALGRFFFTLTASLAEMERNLISERTAAALQQKKANGEFTGGEPPYGFTVGETGVLVPVLAEQGIVENIKVLKNMGCSTRGIAELLALQGARTRKGTTFTQTQIVRILNAA
jgi:site-specific DNA recombinase